MSDFDFKDYAVRQYRILSITFGSFLAFIICGLVARYGNITDRNAAELLVFMAVAAGLCFLMGLYASFVAWFEKKLFQYKKKIDDDSS